MKTQKAGHQETECSYSPPVTGVKSNNFRVMRSDLMHSTGAWGRKQPHCVRIQVSFPPCIVQLKMLSPPLQKFGKAVRATTKRQQKLILFYFTFKLGYSFPLLNGNQYDQLIKLNSRD